MNYLSYLYQNQLLNCTEVLPGLQIFAEHADNHLAGNMNALSGGGGIQRRPLCQKAHAPQWLHYLPKTNPIMHSKLWTDNCFPPICKVLQMFHQILSYYQNVPSASQFLDIKRSYNIERTHQVNKSDTQIWNWTRRPTSDTFNSRSMVLYSVQEKGDKESSNQDSCKLLIAQTVTDIF